MRLVPAFAPAHRRALRIFHGLCVALLLALILSPALTAHADGITYVVQPGENLFRIGLRFGISWRDLMVANGLQSTYIYPGQVLIIPTGGGAVAAQSSAPVNETSETTTAAPVMSEASASPAASSVYIVQRGDTLNLIASRYQLSVSALMQANGLANPNLIYVGQALALPVSTGHWLSVAGRTPSTSLDCESRSAADWAGYFGVYISEFDFLNRLPESDDPDAGFVGSAWGVWGQIPPRSYGVHAEPVAALLREYGLNARAVRNLDWATVRAEIDQDRPVIVWVVGRVTYGTGYSYTAASDGHTTVVAPYEHTVLVTGYSPDTVTVLDGAMSYTRPLAQFMASWSVLGYQAVLTQ